MPNTYGRAFNTANFLSNLAALKAINFGASDPMGCWFIVPNSTTNNIEIWVWEPTSTATTNEIDVVRPDSIAAGSPGRCIQRLKFDASQIAGFLGNLAGLTTTGVVERTTGGGASTNPIAAFGRTFLNLVDAAAARVALALGNVATRNIGTGSGAIRDAADPAYTNARTPTSHASTHQAGGADEIPIFGYLVVSANTTLNATHERQLIDVNATSASITITLPAASTVGAGWLLKVRKNDVSANSVTISRSGSDTINGATSLQITSRFQTIVLLSFGGTSWGVVGAFDDYVRTNPDQTIGGVKTFNGGLVLPGSAGSTIGSVWRNTNNIAYRDSANTVRTLLNSADNLNNLSNSQTARNNLVGTTANRVLRANGANAILDFVYLNSDVSGVLGTANGGTGSNTQNFVDLTTAQSAGGNKTFTGVTNFTNATPSTSTTTGALTIAGGVGVQGDLYVGGSVKPQVISVENTAALNIAANTWFNVGTANGIGINGSYRLYAVVLYIQGGTGTVTVPHWQACGAGIIGVIAWKAGGAQSTTNFRVEEHNSNDFICSLRLGIGNTNRAVEIMFDRAFTTLAPSLLKIDFVRIN